MRINEVTDRGLKCVYSWICLSLALALVPLPQSASAQSACELENTGIPWVRKFDLSADGGWIAFISVDDPVGANPDGSAEVFVYEVMTGRIEQVSDSIALPEIDSPIAISADGNLITYSNRQDDTQYLLNRSNGTSLPLFSPLPRQLEMSGDGTRFAIYSDGDFAGRNADGSVELFLFDRPGNEWTQITDTVDPGPCLAPNICPAHGGMSLSTAGSEVAFITDFPTELASTSSVYLFDVGSKTLEWIDTTAFAGGWPVQVSGAGNRIVYRPPSDLSFNVFDRTTGSTLSSDLIGWTGPSAVNRDGSRILLADGRRNARVFFYEPGSDRYTPLTEQFALIDSLGRMKLDESGTTAAFSANPSSMEITEGSLYVLQCGLPPAATEVPTLGSATLAILALLLAGVGLRYLRRPPSGRSYHSSS